jgi:pyruvate ferredoxin oxidoreductase beta subunit/2-oxoisovalerate ferredoxin oxidoreductase beta subunit
LRPARLRLPVSAGVLKRQGKDDVNVLVMAGDGGTYDIGFQALSAAAERNEDMVYVCLDNEGYMNTGAQKSSSTPYLAVTGSTPGGKARDMRGMRFIVVLTPCLDGCGVAEDGAVRVSRLAVDTGFFPLYEVEDGERYTINRGPKGIPVERYLELQKRYRHLSVEQTREIQAGVDHRWSLLQSRVDRMTGRSATLVEAAEKRSLGRQSALGGAIGRPQSRP